MLAQSPPSGPEIIRRNCVYCHGRPAKGGLDLRTREGMLRGGQRGPALVPGKPEESLIYTTMERAIPMMMPPGSPLPAGTVAIVKRWIEEGAPVPHGGTEKK